MKKIISAVFATAALFCSQFTVFAESEVSLPVSQDAPEIYENETFNDGTITYTKATDGVYITDCEDGITEVNIGEEIDNYKILGIYDYAFSECKSLKTVTISGNMNYIGMGAFAGCYELKTVVLPNGLKKIPDYCFNACKNLLSVQIPASVTEIGNYAFSQTNLGGTLELWEGLENLGAMTYYGCKRIDTVTIPSTLKSVGSLSFIGCQSLEKFEVSPDNLYYKSIDGILYSAAGTMLEIFPENMHMTSFTVPESVLYIQPGAFYTNNNLEEVTMSDNVMGLGETAFVMCKNLKIVTLSNKITEIGSGTFSDCAALTSVAIPDSVTTIGSMAFYGCNSLKSLNVYDNVKTIGEQAIGFTDDMGEAKPHKIDGFKIRTYYNSAAGKYARENHVSTDYIDGNKNLPFIIMKIAAGIAITAVVIIIVVKKKKNHREHDAKNDDNYNDEDDDSDDDDNYDDEDDEFDDESDEEV